MLAIPNMEKPTNCIDCIAHRSYDHDEYFWYGSNYCKALGKYFNKDKLDIDPFKQILPDCPLIEIVRCGECIHRVEDSDFQNGHFCLKRRSNGGLYCEDDDFCSYGERRSDEKHR